MASSNNNNSPSMGGQVDGLEDGSNIAVGRTAPMRRAIDQQPSGTSQVPKSTVHPTTTLSPPYSSSNSPKSSRETSPVRPSRRNASTTSAKSTKPRKNSDDGQHELSPSRAPSLSGPTTPSIPSAAAVQRAMSAAKPQLQPTNNDSSTDLPRPERNSQPRSAETPPHWPVSPRLKSPPPPTATHNPVITRKVEHDTNAANISIKRPTPISSSVSDSNIAALKNGVYGDDNHAVPVPRSGRGASAGSTLETVQEASLPATTSSIGSAASRRSYSKLGDDHIPDAIPEYPSEDVPANLQKVGMDSGSDSGGNKSGDAKNENKDYLKTPTAATSTKPGIAFSRRSFSSLNPNRTKNGSDGSVRNMTVETETVSSVPQVALGPVAGDRWASGRGDGGSLRLKPSNETIRPKKEKKKVSRKPTSIGTGTVSSKADIFEQRVATAVDEANSSDSDETFVYESNPPEQPRQPHRFHSRTPSQASVVSIGDQRPRGNGKDGSQGVVGKRSMKFTNSNYGANIDGDNPNQSVGRGNSRMNGNGATPRHHHHIGRHGRGGHVSLFDGDSPFIQATRSPKSAGGNRFPSSLSSSPRNASHKTVSPRKSMGEYGYDFDAEGADDERTPLVGSVRINRRGGRRTASARQSGYFETHETGCLGRYGACMIVSALLFILIFGGTTFIVALTKPLGDVYIRHLENILASESEIMLDLHVKARNPNLFAITVSDMDVNIFAKSTHIGSDVELGFQQPRQLRSSIPRTRAEPTGNKDEGNDPIEDPEGDSQTMLLGRIFEFDSPLIFESSPFRRQLVSAVGEVRLEKPGNRTEEGGSARWERVLQHPFDLIVRGVLKYQLPLSSKTRSAPVSSSIRVYPKDDVDHKGAMRTGPPKYRYGDEVPEKYKYLDPGLRDGTRPQPYRFVAWPQDRP